MKTERCQHNVVRLRSKPSSATRQLMRPFSEAHPLRPKVGREDMGRGGGAVPTAARWSLARLARCHGRLGRIRTV